MKPILYSPTEMAFDNNGIGVLSDAVSCYVECEVNGLYELEMRYPVDGRRYGEIGERSIILAKPSPYDQPQPFRVYRITAPMRGTVTVYARHIVYDLMGVPVAPFQAANAPAAMQGLSDNAAVGCPFSFSTEKNTVAAMEVNVPKSIWSKLGGSEGSVLDVYGGEYEFDRFSVRLHKRLGADRGVSIRYGKNITTLEQDKNCANVYTGVYPYWTNSEGELVTLPERILYADGNFDHVRIMTLDLSESFETPPTEEQLRVRARSYMKSNNIGIPEISWTIGFVQLAKTAEYKDKALLEEIHLGDTMTVIFQKMGINVSARAVKTRHNVLLDRYESVTLGKVKANISDTVSDNAKKILIESQRRLSADGKLKTALSVQDGLIKAEIKDRQDADSAINTELSIQSGQITAEIKNRQDADNAINTELSLQSGRINAKVEKTGGNPESFGWDLLSDSWTLTSSGKIVLQATKSGIDVNGKITAYEGKIANFDIKQDCLSYNGQTWGGANTTGIYLGSNGIQCGADSYWRNDGYFKAAYGEFTGSVNAGSIRAGDEYGTFSGSGITDYSIGGGKVAGSTLSTRVMTTGINTSLGYADRFNGAVNGDAVSSFYASYLYAAHLYIDGKRFKPTWIYYTDSDGNPAQTYVLAYAS